MFYDSVEFKARKMRLSKISFFNFLLGYMYTDLVFESTKYKINLILKTFLRSDYVLEISFFRLTCTKHKIKMSFISLSRNIVSHTNVENS